MKRRDDRIVKRHPPHVHQWLVEPLSDEVKAAVARLARAPDVQRVAVMPDVHLAEGVCVGNVVATSRLIYPQAVGGDIGCGMAALAFDADAGVLGDETRAGAVLDALAGAVPAMRHFSLSGAPQLPDGLLEPGSGRAALSDDALAKLATREGRIELGTLGRGNHFVELQADDGGRLWLMLHSGSRHMGQAITAFHLRHATRAGGGLFHLNSECDAGRVYLRDVSWARAYALANRRRMVEQTCAVLERLFRIQPQWGTLLLCDHNHVRRERHGGQEFWVHRKGAISAALDEPGIVPGSMGTASYHVAGRGAAEALCSSAHGAGRAMSRDEARRRVSSDELRRQMEGVAFDERLTARLTDEAPAAYKDVQAVLRAQRPLVRIVRRLRPVLVYKGI